MLARMICILYVLHEHVTVQNGQVMEDVDFKEKHFGYLYMNYVSTVYGWGHKIRFTQKVRQLLLLVEGRTSHLAARMI